MKTNAARKSPTTKLARVYLLKPQQPENEIKVAAVCEATSSLTCTLADLTPAPVAPVVAFERSPETTEEVKVDPSTLGVVDQARVAMRPENRAATTVGFLLGGAVPVASYAITHQEILPAIERGAMTWACVLAALVLGGLVFSAKTVIAWANLAFADTWKAVGFGVLIEGVMTLSSNHWLAIGALSYLVGINGVATGCRLALASPAAKKEAWEA